GDLQHVVAGDRILHVQQRGKLATGRFAILDAHLAPLAFGSSRTFGKVQVDPQGTLPLRRREFHAQAFQPEIGQDGAEALCECVRVHQYVSRSQKQKMGSSGPFPAPCRSVLADVPTPGSSSGVRAASKPEQTRRILRPTKKPHEEAFLSKKDLVAGAGFEPATFGL